MDEQAKILVWLKSIEYTGSDVGSDTEFDVTVNGETVRVSSDLKFGSLRSFDRLMATNRTAQAEATVSISVVVVEQDLVDDVGQSTMEYLVRKGRRREALPAIHVSVQENRGISRGATAIFALTFEVEYLATGTVVACCWNGISDKTKTLGNYYAQSARHRRMADYIAGACSYFNLQIAVGQAIGSIEDGVSKPRVWAAGSTPSANWMQVSERVIEKEFIRKYWLSNTSPGVPVPTLDDMFRFDILNAVAGIWYLTTLPSGEFKDGGISYKSVMYKAMQYNWGPESTWPSSKDHCKPDPLNDQFSPSAYAWTMAFLSWGNGYVVADTQYTSHYARYPVIPKIGASKWMEQEKRLSPLFEECNQAAPLPVPEFAVSHTPRLSPYGRRSQRQAPTERQIVILARKTEAGTDHDYISALAIAMQIGKSFRNGIAPMVTADTYFACESMKRRSTGKGVCVIVLGPEAKNDVNVVLSKAHGYSSFSAWSAGEADGYIDATSHPKRHDNYLKALEAAMTAYEAGY